MAAIREHYEEARRGVCEWHSLLKAHRKFLSFQLGWRTFDNLLRLTAQHPQALEAAVDSLLETRDADAFWDELARGGGGEQALEEYQQLSRIGTRAAVASLFLFLDDPERFPMYRMRNFGEPLERLLGQKLDRSTPGLLLKEYYEALDELKKRYQAAGLPAETPLDTQGTLWVLNYMHVLDGINT